MTSGLLRKLLAVLLGVGFAAVVALSEPPKPSESAPASNLDYWLRQSGEPPATQGVAPPDGKDPSPSKGEGGPQGRVRVTDRFTRADAVPGVAILSDGSVLPGGLFTTRDRDFEVWVESENQWRHVPLLMALSIEAVVIEEGLDKEWRWKEMGSDEKVFTGRSKPIRRFRWRFHLIDDSAVTGDVKGQPLWVETPEKRLGPYILHERSDGEYGQTLAESVYLRRVVVSRRAMDQARKSAETQPPSAPAPPTDTR